MDGVLLVDKPAGPTSHDIVARVRRALPRGVKVGHAGTLDPFATGLLLVLLGRATRAQRFLMGLDKSYETVVRLGWTSTTGDPEGELVETGRVPPDPPTLPTGVLRQVPPAYSAVKVGGRRAYALARAGEAVAVRERTVRVDRFEQLWREGDRAAFAIDCSSGTYVRSLVLDLGDAYCLELRRTAIGPFRLEDAAPAPERGATRLPAPPMPLGAALARVLPTAVVGDHDAHLLATGRVIDAPAARRPHPGAPGPGTPGTSKTHIARTMRADRVFDAARGDGDADGGRDGEGGAGSGGEGFVLVLDPAGDPVCVAEVQARVARPRVGFRA